MGKIQIPEYNCILYKQRDAKLGITNYFCLEVVSLDSDAKKFYFTSCPTLDKVVDRFIISGFDLRKAAKITTLHAPYIDSDLGNMHIPLEESELRDFFITYNLKKVVAKLRKKVKHSV